MPLDDTNPHTVQLSAHVEAQTLQPSGVLDRVQGAALRQQVAALVASGVKTVVLDCSGIELIDSAGLGVLVTCLKCLQAVNGNLYLQAVTAPVQLLLTLTGMDDVFTVV